MELNSNAEKQARYRKKEQLKRQAEQILRKWQLEPWKHHLRSQEEVRHLVEAAIKLPSGWTDEDYLNAEKKLYHVYSEIVSPVNQLSNDVHESRNAFNKSICPSDLPKLNSDLIKAVDSTNALASHIISALKLSGCNESDQAAALMEAMRFVGRNLANNHEVPCSQATAMCLTTINPIYPRPNWFTKKLADTLSQQIHPDLLQVVAKYLIK
ncbi:TPA: hypothetical protein JAN72_06580 [Legionella pneumophila]|jgi:hypothetical protein|uniref:Uncharacterized protein n=1 Tax=Legionella pneumophila TaxID=446 RepID=A0AAN5R638_LEGPN|nr:hypothetical protein [Legionella pneumophila]HAT1972308.1 hypothetical protein [Legionella pneumophila]HAT6956427.1 hypothetical protein [Legionella pneumophila]HEN4771757.1 hypothetical protein [Legionella pneumophila]